MRRSFAAVAALALAPTGAAAHAVGERYDLPLPVHLYILGGVLVVALSFALAAVLLRPRRAWTGWRRRPRRGGTAARVLAPAAQILGVALFALTVATGLFGEQHPARNWTTSFVWIFWWIGLGLFAALVADIWPWLNPWRSLAIAAARLFPRLGPRPRAYPKGLAQWPAVFLLLAFVWFELVFPEPSRPRLIAIAALVYSAIVFAGMARFGREAWLRHADPFTVFFAALGRFAPLAIRRDGAAVRGWGGGLALAPPPSPALVAFILLMLAAVLFDGFLGTGVWRALERAVRSLLPPGADRDSLLAASLALLLLWLAFLGAYALAAAAMARLAGPPWRGGELARRFAWTLIPIGIGYNVAHNLSYLLVQGQAVAALASDPFGWGWNLFGTATWQPEIGVVDAGTVWTVALVAIVGGHVVSVYLAHLKALALFASRRTALRALLPMTLLMIVYTGVSLTVIAEPLVRYRVPDPSYSSAPPVEPAREPRGRSQTA